MSIEKPKGIEPKETSFEVMRIPEIIVQEERGAQSTKSRMG